MARDPGSVWAPLPEAGAPDGYTKTQFIVHSTGDNGLARSVRDNWFARSDVVVESTFIVGWGPDRGDPTLQIMDSTDNADANGSANQRGISIEVTGDGTGPFTAWQRSELIRLGLWARKTHGIVPRVIPSESAGGFGWHVMFGAPGPWTTVPGKVCPGATRIGQLKSDIFPAIFAGGTEEDDFMALYAGRDELRSDVYNATWVYPQWTTPDGSRKENPGQFMYWTRATALEALAVAKAAAIGAGLTDEEIAKIVAQVRAGLAEDIADGFDVTLQPKTDPA